MPAISNGRRRARRSGSTSPPTGCRRPRRPGASRPTARTQRGAAVPRLVSVRSRPEGDGRKPVSALAKHGAAPPPGGEPLDKIKLLLPDDWEAFLKSRTEFAKEWDKIHRSALTAQAAYLPLFAACGEGPRRASAPASARAKAAGPLRAPVMPGRRGRPVNADVSRRSRHVRYPARRTVPDPDQAHCNIANPPARVPKSTSVGNRSAMAHPPGHSIRPRKPRSRQAGA